MAIALARTIHTPATVLLSWHIVADTLVVPRPPLCVSVAQCRAARPKRRQLTKQGFEQAREQALKAPFRGPPSVGVIIDAFVPSTQRPPCASLLTREGLLECLHIRWNLTKKWYRSIIAGAMIRRSLGGSGLSISGMGAEAREAYKAYMEGLATGDATSLRNVVTEGMYDIVKKALKSRSGNETHVWSLIAWERMRLLHAAIARVGRAGDSASQSPSESAWKRAWRQWSQQRGKERTSSYADFAQVTVRVETREALDIYNELGRRIGGFPLDHKVSKIIIYERPLQGVGRSWRICGFLDE